MGILKDWLKEIEYSVLSGTDNVIVNDVIFDSRKAKPGTVFVCMKGTVRDSHDFMKDVIEKGCDTFVVEKELKELPVDSTAGLNIIYTSDARNALAYLSCARFDYPAKKLTVVGITGTKGKTTTSFVMKKLFEAAGHKVGVLGTNGCTIGDEHFETMNTTPDSYELNSLFNKMLEKGCDMVVMECSSQGIKMKRTNGLIFDYGIFLNISPDHIGPNEHADFAEYLYYKSRVLSQCKTAIINEDDEHCEEALRLSGEKYKRLIKFSLKNDKSDIYAYDLHFKTGADFTGTIFKTKGLFNETFALSIPGDYNVSNILSMLIVAADMGISSDVIKDTIRDIHVEGRMEVIYKSEKFTVLVDYAHNGVSMVGLMKTLEAYEHNRLVVVFGCGGNRSMERRIGMGTAAAHSADFSVFTSDNSRYEKTEDIMADIEEAYLKAGGDKNSYVKVADRHDAIRYAMEHAEKGDIIAVIGKGHEDYQEINGVRTHFLDKEEILKIKDELGL